MDINIIILAKYNLYRNRITFRYRDKHNIYNIIEYKIDFGQRDLMLNIDRYIF